MRKKFIYFLLIITSILSPLSIIADGVIVRPLPEGDWTWVDQNSQQAFINYEEGREKLIIGVDLEEANSDIVWIIPVPSKPQNVEIDIISQLPVFFGDNVISKAKIEFSDSFIHSYSESLLSQIWTFPISIVFPSIRSGGKGFNKKIASDDLVSVEIHIERAGMIAEVITAQNSQAIYDYFSRKGFNIKQGSISELNSYIKENYSFVVTWIAPEAVTEKNRGQRGIFISFPTSKIYYPLKLTSAYGELKVPITIRVLGHVRPEIFSEIKPYTEISYFTEKYGGKYETKCLADMNEFRWIMELYYQAHGSYPSSLQKLKSDEELGDDTKVLLEDITNNCKSLPSYISESKDEYTMTLRVGQGLFVINSSGFAGFTDKKGFDEEKLVSSELKKFYGDEKPWKGEAEYTKITINAPAKLLKKDLWMKKGRPFKISFALWIINNPIIIEILLYLLIVGLISFLAGGLAGLLCFRKFKKYALLGISNVLTLIGLILIFNYVRKKWEKEANDSGVRFVFSFSIIFVLLWSLPIILLILLG